MRSAAGSRSIPRARAKHGALLDAKLLAQVYLELIGGREPRPRAGGFGRNHCECRTRPS